MGESLRHARIEAGRSIDDLSAATRVRAGIIRGIEEDDFSRCGGDVYARGHIRSLAKAAGIDPAPLLERYAAEHPQESILAPASPLLEAQRIRKAEPGRPNWTAAMIAAIVVVIGFVGFTLVSGGSDDGPAKAGSAPQAGKQGHSVEPGKGAGTVRPTPSASESAIASAPRDKVTVKLEAEGRSWIQAKDHNGRELFEGVLEEGQDKTFQDSSRVDLVLGDAGAVKLFVNGKPVEDEFRPGHVERLSYTKGDPQLG